MTTLIIVLCLVTIVLCLIYAIGDWQIRRDYNDLIDLKEITEDRINQLVQMVGPEVAHDLLMGEAYLALQEIEEEENIKEEEK